MKKPISLISVVAISLTLSACGNARKPQTSDGDPGTSTSQSNAQNPPTGPMTVAAQMLHPQFVRSSEVDPTVPGDIADASINVSTPKGSTIEFNNRIPVLDPQKKTLFLTFSKEALNPGIRFVSAEHHQKTGEGALKSRHKSVGATLDEQRGIWFIPLSEIFSNQGNDVDPMASQGLTLNLTLTDGSNAQVEIVFKAQGQFPQIAPKHLDRDLMTPVQFSKSAGDDGMVLSRDQYTNPASYAMKLLVRSVPQAAMKLTTFLAATRNYMESYDMRSTETGGTAYSCPYNAGIFYPQTCNTAHISHPQVLPAPQSYAVSEASFLQSKLKVIRADGTSAEMDAKASPWIEVPLAAGETIELKWIASMSKNTSRCNAESTFNRNVRVHILTNHITMCAMHCGTGDGSFKSADTWTEEDKMAAAVDSYSLSGWALSGAAFKRTVVLADPDFKLDPQSRIDVLDQSGEVKLIQNENLEDNSSSDGLVGPVSQAEKYSCQGVF